MKRVNSFIAKTMLCVLCAAWSLFYISSTFAAEKAAMGVVVITHGAPIPQWNETIMRLIGTVESPYPVEPAFLDFYKERTLAKAANKFFSVWLPLKPILSPPMMERIVKN